MAFEIKISVQSRSVYGKLKSLHHQISSVSDMWCDMSSTFSQGTDMFSCVSSVLDLGISEVFNYWDLLCATYVQNNHVVFHML